MRNEDIIRALTAIGLALEGSPKSTELVFTASGGMSFNISGTREEFVRFPTKRRTIVKFNSIEELVQKIQKQLDADRKQKEAAREKNNALAQLKETRQVKLEALCESYDFQLRDSNLYLDGYAVRHRFSPDEAIQFRVNVAGVICDMTPDTFIDFFRSNARFIASNRKS